MGSELHLQAVQSQYNVQLAASQIQKLRHEATGLMSGQGDATDLLLNVEAARNDPNVRIYRNDAIINAEIAVLKLRVSISFDTLAMVWWINFSNVDGTGTKFCAPAASSPYSNNRHTLSKNRCIPTMPLVDQLIHQLSRLWLSGVRPDSMFQQGFGRPRLTVP